MVLVLLGRYDEAVADYEQVLQTSPEDAYTHLNLAKVYLKLSEDSPHRREIEKAQAHFLLAMKTGIPGGLAHAARAGASPGLDELKQALPKLTQ